MMVVILNSSNVFFLYDFKHNYLNTIEFTSSIILAVANKMFIFPFIHNDNV